MKNKSKRLLASVLACALLVGQNYYAPRTKASTIDGVTIRQTKNDVVISVTNNAPVTYNEMQEAVDGAIASEHTNVNTTNIDTTDLSNWYVYDHFDTAKYANKSAWLTASENQMYNEKMRPYYSYTEKYYLNTSGVYTKIRDIPTNVLNSTDGNSVRLGSHIDAYNDSGKSNMLFYGYGTGTKADFLFYPATSSGIKKVEFDVNARNVRLHSLASSGFLFNTYESGGMLYGYAMMFVYSGPTSQSSTATGISNVQLVKLDGVRIADLHASSNASDNFLVPPSGGNRIKNASTLATIPLSSYTFSNKYDLSTITMEIQDDKFSAKMRARGSDANDSDVVVLFEEYSLDSTGNGGFGPIVNYSGISHNCKWTSSYEFTDLKMSIVNTSSILDSFSMADYTQKFSEDEESNRFYVVIGDNGVITEDKFVLFEDQAFLELLKNEKVVLITNLDITDNVLNHSNYNVVEYLGAGNVFQIPTGTVDEMADQINTIVTNNKFNVDTATASLNATAVENGGSEVAGANLYVTYKDAQIERINSRELDATGIDIRIVKDHLVVNPTPNIRYTLTKPDASAVEIIGTTFTITNDVSLWPKGQYTLNMTYLDASDNPIGIPAVTYFNMMPYYDVELNGSTLSSGTGSDNVSVKNGTTGKNVAAEGNNYLTTLVADSGYTLPAAIKVMVGETLLQEGIGYTYNNSTGAIVILASSVIGNINIVADTFKITTKLTGLTATGDTNGSSYSPSCTVTLSSAPKSIAIRAEGQLYYLTNGASCTIGSAGTVSYSTSLKKVTISSNTGCVDVEIIAAVGSFSLNVNSSNMNTGTDNYPKNVSAGVDQTIKLYADAGYENPDAVTVTVGGETLTEGYTYSKETGTVFINGSFISGPIVVAATGVAKSYDIESEVLNVGFSGIVGENQVTHGVGYTASLIKVTGYNLPDTIEVYVGGTLISTGYNYNSSTGSIVINGDAILGNICIKANGVKEKYSVSLNGQNISALAGTTGSEAATYTETYQTVLSAEEYYSLPASISVTVDGIALDSNGFTYNSSTGEVVILATFVTGNVVITANAKDTTAPTAKITVDANNWTTVTDTTAKVYYDIDSYVEILGFDLGDGVDKVYYHISNASISDTSTIAWREYDYSNQPLLDSDGEYIIYAKVVDFAGNSVIINSCTLVMDQTNPSIKDIADGDVFYEYEKLEVEIIESNLESITIDGSIVLPVDGKVTIGADDLPHTIVVTDKAGNVSSYDIIVYRIYRFIYQPDLNSVGVSVTDEKKGDVPSYTIRGEYFTRDYYTQVGWSLTLGGDVDYNFNEIYTTNADLTLYPVWVANDYSVTTNFVKLGPDVLPDATHASDYSFTITVDQGYILPSVIEIISGTTELIKDVDYTYNSSTGEVEIFGPSIVGAISITSSGLAKNYDVVLNGVNLDATYGTIGIDKATQDTVYTTMLTADIYYALPSSIQIMVDSSVLENGVEYTYSKETGVIVIAANKVTGTVTINADAVDITPPSGLIRVDSHVWDSQSDPADIIYISSDQEVVISATDLGDGVDKVLYYISSSVINDPSLITWQEYDTNNKPCLEEDGSYIIYATVQDLAGNKTSFNSVTIILDKTNPSLKDTIDGESYYNDYEFVVEEANIDTITVDGVEIELVDDKYTITADDGEHIIHIIDKAGNSIEYTIYVYKTYYIRYIADSFSMGENKTETKTGDVPSYTIKKGLFSRDHYTQIGWSMTEYGSVDYDFEDNYTVNADLNLYPVWQVDEYTVVTEFVNLGPDTLPNATNASEYDFTIVPEQGYSLPETIDVVSGNVTLVQDVDYTYDNETGAVIILSSKVVGAVVITASGVDTTLPACEVSVGELLWDTTADVSKIEYLTTKPQDVIISASDNEEGIGSIEYIISNEIILDVEQAIWEQYDSNNVPVLSEDGTYIIYAKATDKAGNHIIVNSCTIIIDTTAPEVNEIKEGGVYYGDKEINIPSDLVTITVDGKEVVAENGKIIITADDKQHVIVIKDAAGNTTEYTVSVYKVYTITYLPGKDSAGSSLVEKKNGDVLSYIVRNTLYTRQGYTQIGWSAVDGSSNVDFAFASNYSKNSDITLYPVWEKNAILDQINPDKTDWNVTHPSYIDSNDGSIKGLPGGLEYSKDNGETWISVVGDKITKLSKGTYLFRYSATEQMNASNSVTVTLRSIMQLYNAPVVTMSKVLGKNNKFQIKLINKKGAKVKCASSDKRIATVSKKGLVKTKNKTGACTIYVSIKKGKNLVQYEMNLKVKSGIKYNYSLVKQKASNKSPSIALYKLIKKGKTWKISFANVKNTSSKVTFTNKNKDLVSVSKKGVVKAKKAGKATVVANVKKDGVTNKYYVVIRIDDGKTKSDTSYLKVIK